MPQSEKPAAFTALCRLVYQNLFELVLLNFLILLSGMFLITLPAACTAASRIALHIVRGEGYRLWGDYWREFRSSFRQSLFAGGPLLLCGALSGIGTVICYEKLENPLFYGGFLFGCAVFALLCGMAIYLFPLISTVELNGTALLKNSFLLCFLYLSRTLGAFFAIAGLTLVFLLLLPYTFPVFFLLHFSLISLFTAASALPGVLRCSR